MSLSPPEHIAAQVRSSSTLPASPVPAASLQPPLRAFLQTGGALLATFAVGFAGGIVAKLLHFPLPYMTGSLLITAAAWPGGCASPCVMAGACGRPIRHRRRHRIVVYAGRGRPSFA